MRDLNQWKDKVELQLDGRQIFFLFFGSAVCACLIFVLGVVVGKRMEARVVAQSRDSVEDPLAVLDELGNAEEGFTFHNALAERPERHEGRKPRPVGKDALKEPAKDELAAVADEPVDEPKAKGEVKGDAKGEVKGEAKGDDREPKVEAAKPDKKEHVAAQVKKPAEDKAQPKADKPAAAAAADKTKGHFTLQLSAFATKTEATDLMKKLRDAGYKPFMVETTVPGKGLMYRVRLGDYGTRDNALTAKSDFERKQKMVAYVAKL